MTIDFTNYKQQYQVLIDQVMKSVDLEDNLKDRIHKLFYFLNEFPQLLTHGATEANINTESYFIDLLTKYRNGRKKPSLKIKKDLVIGGTIPDQMVRSILQKSEKCDDKKIDGYINGHNLAMSAENLLGSLLERYIASVIEDGWIWCPGQTIFATDFIKYSPTSDKQWICLQVKNADNSENSSSSKIRQQFKQKGYEGIIEIWFRSRSKWTLAGLKSQVYFRLGVEGDDQLKQLKKKLKNSYENFTLSETWISIAREFKLDDLVDEPKRITNWDKLNKIVGLSSNDSMSEQKFAEYISSLYPDEHGENVISNITENSD